MTELYAAQVLSSAAPFTSYRSLLEVDEGLLIMAWDEDDKGRLSIRRH